MITLHFTWIFPGIFFVRVTIHEHLSWKMHMECILKQIRINFGRARKMSSLFKKSTNNALQLCDKKAISISSWYFGSTTMIHKLPMQCAQILSINIQFEL